MQTFDVSLPTSHAAPTRNGDNHFVSEKPPKGGELFGDVMNRALHGTPREPAADENESQAEQPVKSASAQSTPTDHTKEAGKSKKTQHRAAAKKTDDTATANAAMMTCPPQISQITPTADEGSSEDGSDSAEDQQVTAKGNSDPAMPQPMSAQFLALAGSLGIPLPQPPASAPTPSTSTSKEGKGSSGSAKVSPDLAPAMNSNKITGETVTVETDDETHSESSAQPSAETAAPKPDLKEMAAKPAEEHSKSTAAAENPAATATSPPTASNPSETAPNKASVLEAVTAASITPSEAQISKIKASAGKSSVTAMGNVGGTSAAKQYIEMKNAEKTTKVAGLAQQDLPGNSAIDSDELPTGQKASLRSLAHGDDKAVSTALVETPAAHLSTTPEPAASNMDIAAIAPAGPTEGRLQVLERTHDIVAMHAVKLAQTNSDSLHVVVKPSEGVQLSLELRRSEGSIEVHASLHKGDFEHLSQYWPDLQQRLEARGVRMGSLTTSDHFTSTGQQQQSKQQPSRDHDSLSAGAFAEFALSGSMNQAPAARAARANAYRGWETWA